MSGHTPGPWRATNGNLVRVFPNGSDRPICGVHRRGQFSFGHEPEETAANARLIAAAPDMIEALRTVGRVLSALKATKTNDELWAAYSQVIAAIAKAEPHQ